MHEEILFVDIDYSKEIIILLGKFNSGNATIDAKVRNISAGLFKEQKYYESKNMVLITSDYNKLIGIVSYKIGKVIDFVETITNDNLIQNMQTIKIEYIAIDESYQRQGYGKLLFNVTCEKIIESADNYKLANISINALTEVKGFYDSVQNYNLEFIGDNSTNVLYFIDLRKQDDIEYIENEYKEE